jgi:vancomycin permeability regulator SanA
VELRILRLDAANGSRAEPFAQAIPRALALFLGVFSLLNLGGNLLRANFDANLSWIDLRFLPAFPARLVLLLAALSLVACGIKPPRSYWRKIMTIGSVGLVAAIALWNTMEFYWLLLQGQVHSLMLAPLSLILLIALMFILRAVARPVRTPAPAGLPVLVTVLLVSCCIVFPLAQMVCFGNTDYRRQADVAVVFGARTYADGRPSDALADRVRTACQLYHDGQVRKLIFSGGPGDGAVTEPEAMKRMAMGLGVKPEDILTDAVGLNTQATVKDTETLFARLNAHRVLVVSHFYHLPRIKLAYQRAGWDVYTVPARESHILWKIPYFMAREVPATWIYYLRPLVR